MSSTPGPVSALHRGFRSSYLDYAELTAQVKSWAESYPKVVRLTSLGTTPGGREQWLITIGTEPDRIRSAAWVDGNMHASEVAGSSVALAIAEDLIRLHVEGSVRELPAPIADRLKHGLVYVLPRMSPDGAEQVLKSGRYVRSVPRDERPDRAAPRWLSSDVDGDGRMLVMRVKDSAGDYVEAPNKPGVMVQRDVADAGPFYRIYPEGTIEHWDGHTIPAPHYLGDNPIDLNRNFPWSWSPHHEQPGAGPFPASEPEARNVIAFVSKHPEIFSWLNLHTYGGVLIRPLGHAPDSKMDQDDLAVFRQLEVWMDEHAGYPTVSGFEEFLYEPDKPLHGDLTDFAYNQRGTIAYVVELWDLFAKLGLPRPKKFVDYYAKMTRADLVKLAWWDHEENSGRVFQAWKPFHHPQLGAVEVGGIDPRVGIWNPPYEKLDAVCVAQSEVYLRLASLAPALKVGAVTRTPVGDGLTRVDVRIENVGYLPTYVLESAKKLDWNEAVHVDCWADGCTLMGTGEAHQSVGHLDGWGRGLYGGANEPAFMRSKGNANAARATYLVRGTGALKLRIGSCRVGWIIETISV
jgi:Zinc carboxypeptidase